MVQDRAVGRPTGSCIRSIK